MSTPETVRLKDPEQLYLDWEREHWASQDIDLSRDPADWEGLEDEERDVPPQRLLLREVDGAHAAHAEAAADDVAANQGRSRERVVHVGHRRGWYRILI